MVKACCVSTCKEQWVVNGSVSFFAFPFNNEELKEKWLRAGPGYKTVSKNSFVCSKHFLPDDYTDWTAYGGMRKFKKHAVPSIFNPVCSTDIDHKIPDSDDNNYSGCGSSSEANVVNEPQVANLQTPSNKFEAVARSSAKRLRESQDDEKPAKKFCSVAVQTCPRLSGSSDREKELQAKIHLLQDRLRRRDKAINNVKDLLAHLKDAGECSDSLEETFFKKFTNFDLELFKNEEKNRNVGKNAKSYTQEMKEFASTLYFYSPRAYEFVRTKINLPHTSTLRRWVGNYVIDAGFIDSVFAYLQKEIANKKYLKNMALIFDLMAIRKQVLFDSKTEKCRGLVDYGKISDNLKSKINSENLAKEALVFQIVSYGDKFKIPIANFFIDGCSAAVQSELLMTAIQKLYGIGIIIRSITCDDSATNERTLKHLGCDFSPNNLVTHFKHPCHASNIHVIFDPSHMMKLCRNTFAEKKIVSNKGEIRFNYVEDLHKIQEEEGFKLANRLSQSHLLYKKKKMKVSLATQVISSGVADSIDFLRSAGYENFEGSEATSEFLRFFDRLFDIQNTRSLFGRGFKSPLTLQNAHIWENIFEESEAYIRSLKLDGRSILAHERKMFALGFLINIRSFRNLAYDLLANVSNPLKYFLTYKCSQDHLELHFCCLRSRGGWNNNPNVLQFLWSTRRLLYRNSVSPSRNANCIADDYDQTPILEFRNNEHSNNSETCNELAEMTEVKELM